MAKIALLAAAALLSLSNVAGQAPNPKVKAPASPATRAQQQTSQSRNDGITREQADEILKELRAIRLLLERQAQGSSPRGQNLSAPRTGKITVGSSPVLGAADALITVVEYADYQCPYCNRFHNTTFEELKRAYIETGKVQFISRDLPLNFHPNAVRAAQAARCAGEQGKFWQLRDLLIRNASALDLKSILTYAQQASLDPDKFSACVNGEKYINEIRLDVAEANALGISGTPSFIIGRRNRDAVEGFILVGAVSYAVFDARIKELLAKP